MFSFPSGLLNGKIRARPHYPFLMNWNGLVFDAHVCPILLIRKTIKAGGATLSYVAQFSPELSVEITLRKLKAFLRKVTADRSSSKPLERQDGSKAQLFHTFSARSGNERDLVAPSLTCALMTRRCRGK
jgi:hypothetical protein